MKKSRQKELLIQLMNMDKKYISVDWLFDQLWETPRDKFAWRSILDKAIAIHKEEIKEAYKCGATDLEIQYSDVGEINSEEYYKETYE